MSKNKSLPALNIPFKFRLKSLEYIGINKVLHILLTLNKVGSYECIMKSTKQK